MNGGHSLRAALLAGKDVLGEQVLARGEPSYEAMAPLLPPLGQAAWAPFAGYPIVLGLAGGSDKIRLHSTGAGIDLDMSSSMTNLVWRQAQVEARVLVGPYLVPMGEEKADRIGPRYERGYLPVVQTGYREDGVRYELEVFAAPLSEQEPVVCGFVRIRATVEADQRRTAYMAMRLTKAPERMLLQQGRMVGRSGRVYLVHEEDAQVDPHPDAMVVMHRLELEPGQEAARHFLLPYRAAERLIGQRMSEGVYRERRNWTIGYWEKQLTRAARIQTPEARVNDAWQALVIGNFLIAEGDELRYSALNGYHRMYGRECGDATMAMAMLGYGQEARQYLARLLRHELAGAEIGLQESGFKLQFVARYVRLYEDWNFLKEHRPLLEKMAQQIVELRRTTEVGLLPPEHHCDDMQVKVYPLSQNANCWRGIRDLGLLLTESGQEEKGRSLLRDAEAFRAAIWKAVDASSDYGRSPAFVSYQLYGQEKPYEHTTGRYDDTLLGMAWQKPAMGAYYNLMMPYVLGSGVFGVGDQRNRMVMEYLEQCGGILLGLVRMDKHCFRSAMHGIDDLYGLRYNLACLREGRIERALLAFYGKLAHGMTRETYLGGECTEVRAEYRAGQGRIVDQPPNSTANASFLQTLRHMLVMEVDEDDDGVEETLRLLSGTPRAWLAAEEGKTKRIVLERLPTTMGMVGLELAVQGDGVITGFVELPESARMQRVRLWLRRPGGVTAGPVLVNGKAARCVGEVVDLSGMKGRVEIRCECVR